MYFVNRPYRTLKSEVSVPGFRLPDRLAGYRQGYIRVSQYDQQCAGAFVQCSIGFGLAVVAAPLLFFIDPAYVPGPVIATALLISVLNSLRFCSQLSIGRLGPAIIGRIPGCFFCIWVLTLVSREALSILLGAACW